MKALSVSVFQSVGQGLNAANQVGSFSGLEILECNAQDGQLLLVVDGSPADVSSFHRQMQSLKPLRERLFEKLDPQVWQAHLSLTNSDVRNNIFVIETDFFGDLLLTVELMLDAGAACIDLRAARGAARAHCALMTSATEIAIEKLGSPNSVAITLVRNVSPALRNFLDLRPNKSIK